jgi:hypothetical protein
VIFREKSFPINNYNQSYRKIKNPNSQLIIDGLCTDECNSLASQYFFIYFSQELGQSWTLLNNTNGLVIGKSINIWTPKTFLTDVRNEFHANRMKFGDFEIFTYFDPPPPLDWKNFGKNLSLTLIIDLTDSESGVYC